MAVNNWIYFEIHQAQNQAKSLLFHISITKNQAKSLINLDQLYSYSVTFPLLWFYHLLGGGGGCVEGVVITTFKKQNYNIYLTITQKSSLWLFWDSLSKSK